MFRYLVLVGAGVVWQGDSIRSKQLVEGKHVTHADRLMAEFGHFPTVELPGYDPA